MTALTLLLIIYALCFCALALRRLDWAIYWIVLTLPSYLIRFSVGPFPMTVLELNILILFLIWLITVIPIKIGVQKQTKNNPPRADWIPDPAVAAKAALAESAQVRDDKTSLLALSLFLTAATLSVFISPNLRAAAGIWKAYFIEPILFLIVLLNVIKTQKQTVSVMWALAGSIIIPGLFAVYQKFTGSFIHELIWQAENTRRVTSFYGYPNAIGLYFAPIVTGLIAITIHKIQLMRRGVHKDPWKLLLLIPLLSIGLSSIIFARSKGALLGIAAAFIFYALFWKSKRLIFASVIGLIGLISLIGLIRPMTPLNPFNPFQLLTPLFQSNPSTITGGDSVSVRLEQWRETWQMLKTRPVLGAGLAGYQTAVAPYHTKDYIEIYLYPHNIFLTFWSETGLLGLIAFCWIIFLFFKNAFQIIKPSSAVIPDLIRNPDNKNKQKRFFLFSFLDSRLRGNDTAVWSLSAQNQSHIPMSIAGAMVALLAHGLVDVPYFKNDLAMLFWTLLGLMMIIHQQNTAHDTVSQRS